MAVTVGTPTFNTGSDGGTTFSHTVETGSDRLLYVSTSFRNGDVSGVTYDGVSMTELHNVNVPSGGNTLPGMRSYVLVNPPEGAHDVVVTGTGNSQATIALALFGVDQTTPHRTTNTHYNSDSSNASTSVTATSESDDLVLDSGRASPTDAPALTEGSGQTVLVNSGAFNNRGRAFCSTKSGASPDVTMSWTWNTGDTANDRSVQGATSFIPASAGTTEGTISQTLPVATQALDGAVVPSGTASTTLPGLTQAVTGSTGVDATGSASTTLPGLAQAAEGTSAVVGSLGITLAGGTFNIVPNSDNTMSGRRPLGEDTWDPNDPGTIAVVQGSASVNEDDGTITLSATRSGGTGAASVNWATQDGTAVDGTDYTSDSGTLNWADLETGTKSAVISIIDRDGVAQGNTEFTWVLSGASGAEIRTDGGEPLDTTTVTINDQDTAGGAVNVLWNGDFEDGVGLGWHRVNDANVPNFHRTNKWNGYGFPPEFGGNGDLFEIVTSPTRGNDNYSMRCTVKNGANWTEPDDCMADNCDLRRSNVNGANMWYVYEAMPKMNTYWIAFSVYLASGWKVNVNENGPSIFSFKPDFLPSRSQLGIQLRGPGATWRVKHGNHDVYQEIAPDWKQEYVYHSEILNSYPDLEQHFPNTSDSLAALGSVNVGGWTDWVWHLRYDYRGAGDGGQGFVDMYKREDSGPWVHVLELFPGNVTYGGQTRDMGIGYNADHDWISTYGQYADASWYQDASVNQTIYLSGFRLYDGGALFDDIVNDRFGS